MKDVALFSFKHPSLGDHNLESTKTRLAPCTAPPCTGSRSSLIATLPLKYQHLFHIIQSKRFLDDMYPKLAHRQPDTVSRAIIPRTFYLIKHCSSRRSPHMKKLSFRPC